jgi:hypothetical protein
MAGALDSLARSSGIELGLESSHIMVFSLHDYFSNKKKDTSAARGGSGPKTICADLFFLAQ